MSNVRRLYWTGVGKGQWFWFALCLIRRARLLFGFFFM